jgi:hypothetical protein
MRKALSFSLWGNDPKYVVGMRKNIELAARYYPGWEVWVCTTEEHRDFECDRKIVYDFDAMPDSLFWRIKIATYDFLDIVCIRDADSRISARERDAVAEWEESETALHVMRDHPAHGAPIMGGMWGCRPTLLPEGFRDNLTRYRMDLRMDGADKRETQPYEGRFGWMSDQPFLTAALWDVVPAHDRMVHDDYKRYEGARNFRVPKTTAMDFVGQVYSATDEAKYKCE